MHLAQRQSVSTLIVLGVLALGIGACDSTGSADDGAAILLFAAASTSEAVSQATEAFEEDTGIRIATSFASSATLAQQIAAGADAGVFLSAHNEWADTLEDAGLAVARTEVFGNHLILIVPDDSRIEISSTEDLRAAAVERIALGDPETVPAGQYAKAALQHVGAWDALSDKIVPAVDVRQALLYVERGEVEAGIVYATDAAISDKVRVVTRLEPTPGQTIRYSLVLVAEDIHARQLYDFLQSDEAAAIFKEYGFEIP